MFPDVCASLSNFRFCNNGGMFPGFKAMSAKACLDADGVISDIKSS